MAHQRPRPNGNEFENFVVAETPKRWFGFIKAEVSVGNLMTLGSIIIAGTLFWARTTAHMDDHTIHQTPAEKEAAFDRWYDLKAGSLEEKVRSDQSAIKDIKADVAGLRSELGPDSALQRRMNRVLESK